MAIWYGNLRVAACEIYDYFIVAGYVFVLCFFSRIYNSYLLGFTRIEDIVFSRFLLQIFSVLVIYVIVSAGWTRFKSPYYFFHMLGLQLLVDCAWSFIANSLYLKLNPPKRTIFIYRSEADKVRFGSIEGKSVGQIYKIEKELQYRGLSFQEIKRELSGFEAVFVAGVSSRCRNGILKYCVEQDIPVFSCLILAMF